MDEMLVRLKKYLEEILHEWIESVGVIPETIADELYESYRHLDAACVRLIRLQQSKDEEFE